MTNTDNTPELIEDAVLDAANGGLLLPAVQKVREAAARLSAVDEDAAKLTKPGVGTLSL